MLTFGVKLAYWIGQLAEGLKNSSFSILLLFYFNQVMGVSGTLCGLALFIATLVDAVTDPMMGTISDNWHSKLGRRHPFMYASALPLAVCFYFLFNPMVTGEFSLFLWLLTFTVLTRISMTLYHVPHLALGAELTSDFDERTSIVAYRMVFGVSGWLLVAGLGFGYFFAATDEYANGQLNPDAYPTFILIISIGIFLSIMVTSFGTRSLIPHLPGPVPGADSRALQVFEDLQQALRNRSFRALVLAFIMVSVPVGIAAALGLYVNTFYWELTPSQLPLVLLAQFIATLIGYVVSPAVGRRWDKKPVLIGGVSIWALATASPYLLRFTGLFPDVPSATSLALLIGFAFIAGTGIAQLIVAISSMMADVADEHRLDTGKRNEGVFFGAFAFTNKAAGGLGSGIGGVLLDVIAWPTGENIKTAQDIPTDTLFQLAVIGGPMVALSFFPFYYAIRAYSLDRKRHAEILAALG
jgi:GPH family glycoside/pentoside/hexuronide:cation symporter